jgi:hypothetical protein
MRGIIITNKMKFSRFVILKNMVLHGRYYRDGCVVGNTFGENLASGDLENGKYRDGSMSHILRFEVDRAAIPDWSQNALK